MFQFLFAGSITKDTGLVLVNAVHFKSDWAYKFEYIYDDFFYVTPINKVTVKMMTLTRHFQYFHDKVLKFKALELPYKVIILLINVNLKFLKMYYFVLFSTMLIK